MYCDVIKAVMKGKGVDPEETTDERSWRFDFADIILATGIIPQEVLPVFLAHVANPAWPLVRSWCQISRSKGTMLLIYL